MASLRQIEANRRNSLRSTGPRSPEGKAVARFNALKSGINALDEKSPIGDVYSRSTDAFTRLQRRIDSAERSYYRALTQLQQLRQGLGDDDGPGPELPSAPPPDNPAPPPEPATVELASFVQPATPEARCLEEMSGRQSSLPPALSRRLTPVDRSPYALYASAGRSFNGENRGA